LFKAKLFSLLRISYAASSHPKTVDVMDSLIFSFLVWGEYCPALQNSDCQG